MHLHANAEEISTERRRKASFETIMMMKDGLRRKFVLEKSHVSKENATNVMERRSLFITLFVPPNR